jgi:hypothetical protein
LTNRAGSLQEQANGFGCPRVVWIAICGGSAERWNVKLELAEDPKRFAARRQNVQSRTTFEQRRGQLRTAPGDVLAVVQDK